MRTSPLVSCVIPVFNGERYLAAAIGSALAQTHRAVEIIVVDDGSTDATRSVAETFGASITYVHQNNAGPSSARNRGIQRASGDFVAFLDADDLWRPDKIEIQLGRFDGQSALAISSGYMCNFVSPDAQIELAGGGVPEPNLGSSFMAPRSLFAEIGMLDPALRHRDLHEFVLRASDAGRVVEALLDVLVDRRIHDANMSHNRNAEGELELLAIARARIARRRQSRP
jgi:glycosyltransferase involved in cell wall biosynthesis